MLAYPGVDRVNNIQYRTSRQLVYDGMDIREQEYQAALVRTTSKRVELSKTSSNVVLNNSNSV